tara:strand:- start:703 stop:1017 length:315 start_codon:yes stop_codon:yes gene_type:complete
MRLRDIDIMTGTYTSENGELIDALSSVFMIEWEGGEPSYVEIYAIAEQTMPCYRCGGISEKSVVIFTEEGHIISCALCKMITRDPKHLTLLKERQNEIEGEEEE